MTATAACHADTVRRIRQEGPISIRDERVAAQFPGRAYSSRLRYCIRGVGGGIKLESFRLGREYFTSIQACERFIIRISTPANELQSGDPTPPHTTPSLGDAEAARALTTIGI